MARRSSSLFLAFILLLNLVVILTTSRAKAEQPDKHVSLFIFGDSFFDAGNNNYINTTAVDQANYRPYGITYFDFPTGRFSNGRLIPDFIAKYANLPLIPPFLQPGFDIDKDFFGVNFASDGAGALVETFQGFVIDLKTQLRNYEKVEKRLRYKLGHNETKIIISEAVYMFSIGSNDYTVALLINSTIVKSRFVEMVIGNLTRVIKEIYKTGGRKFAFINMPPLGCVPAMRILRPEDGGRCVEEASLIISLHNKALSKLLFEMERQLDGFKYSLFDYKTNLQQRIDHPSKFGFKEGKTACCGTGPFRGVYSCGGKRLVKEYELCKSPNEYVFWDSWHFTEMTYKQLADKMWSSGLHNFFNIVRPEVGQHGLVNALSEHEIHEGYEYESKNC